MIKLFKLHPASVKAIQKGHPWVTLDSFSRKFPNDKEFIFGGTDKDRPVALLLHDPEHKQIRARLWIEGTDLLSDRENFQREFAARLKTAIAKRLSLGIQSERDNFYLLFGEADFIPGLFIQKFKDRIFIQSKMSFWSKKKSLYKKFLKNTFEEMFPNEELSYWFQERKISKKGSLSLLFQDEENLPKHSSSFLIEEFGINYQIRIHASFDPGIYTDMSAQRKELLPLIKESKNILNLYSYTGAYSLYALKNSEAHVTSVDLSSNYLDWLEENLNLNPELDKSRHTTVLNSVQNSLEQFSAKQKQFDLIICDPPSSSNDGNVTTQAFKEYENLVPRLFEVTQKNGYLVLFLNTHEIRQEKFHTKIKEIVKTLGKVKILPINIKLKEDCPTLKGFPEGNYLKGIVLQKQF
tara:strand:- start:10782 stop:12008 length:1227 start_codon:yes stop_codon:yes gene_type:complete